MSNCMDNISRRQLLVAMGASGLGIDPVDWYTIYIRRLILAAKDSD